MGGYLQALRQYGVFQGRASRPEFWQFFAVLFGLAFLTLIVDSLIPKEQGKQEAVLTAVLLLVYLVPSYAVTARRLHDTDRSGWMILLMLIPFVGLVLIVFACLRGTAGPNHYGPDPLVADGVGLSIRQVPPGGPSSAPAATGRGDVIAELERLGRLRADGHLSEAEFAVMKADALSQGRG